MLFIMHRLNYTYFSSGRKILQ